MFRTWKITCSLFISLFFILSGISGQWRIPVDSVYQIIKTHSIYQNAVSWAAIDANFENCVKSSLNNEEIINCLVKVFDQLNDVSSSLIYRNKTYPGYKVNMTDNQISFPSIQERIKREQGKIKTTLLNDKYAYIQIPSFNESGNKINNFAQAIADSISKYDNPNTKGIIVDLRLNMGGQLAAMLSGLHSLLGDGTLGGEFDVSGKISSYWNLEAGNFIQQGSKMTPNTISSGQMSQLPVVILIGTETKNSGGSTAIAFKFRPNTFFVGESTAEGFTTLKSTYPISNELTLDLATAYAVDRKGHIYPHYIPTDTQIVGGDDFDNLMNDHKIKFAIRWFERKNFK